MRSFLAAVAITFLASLLSPSTGSAQGISIGPGGVRVETRRERDWDRRGRRGYDRRGRRGYEGRGYGRRGDRCRTVVERRRNRSGEVVTRRSRVCR